MEPSLRCASWLSTSTGVWSLQHDVSHVAVGSQWVPLHSMQGQAAGEVFVFGMRFILGMMPMSVKNLFKTKFY